MDINIQNIYFKDMSKYMQNIKLGTDIRELKKQQNAERRGAFASATREAATVEISELAKAKYAESADIVSKHAESADRVSKHTESADTASKHTGSADTASKYEGLSGIEREQKELEDYIAGHPVDASMDMLRKNRQLSQYDASMANLVDEDLVIAENEYTKAFTEAAEGFADFSMRITYGAYSGNDVSAQDLNFDAVDRMADLYDSYKEQIQANYEGSEQEKYLNKLDEVYNAVFAEKIISPVRTAYDNKMSFFQPDSEEAMRSIKASSSSRDSLNEMISGYIAGQSISRRQHGILADGTEEFYKLAGDSSLWHDRNAVRQILTDSMNVYASVKESAAGSSVYLSAKAAADAIAKKVSDQYAQMLAYREERLGISKDGKGIEEGQAAQKSINDFIQGTSSGMFTVDFSKIGDLLNSLIDNA